MCLTIESQFRSQWIKIDTLRPGPLAAISQTTFQMYFLEWKTEFNKFGELSFSFRINFTCYQYTAAGNYFTLCVQMLDGAN